MYKSLASMVTRLAYAKQISNGDLYFSTKKSFHRLGHFAVEERGPFSMYKPLTQSQLLRYSFFFVCLFFVLFFCFFIVFFFLLYTGLRQMNLLKTINNIHNGQYTSINNSLIEI